MVKLDVLDRLFVVTDAGLASRSGGKIKKKGELYRAEYISIGNVNYKASDIIQAITNRSPSINQATRSQSNTTDVLAIDRVVCPCNVCKDKLMCIAACKYFNKYCDSKALKDRVTNYNSFVKSKQYDNSK